MHLLVLIMINVYTNLNCLVSPVPQIWWDRQNFFNGSRDFDLPHLGVVHHPKVNTGYGLPMYKIWKD